MNLHSSTPSGRKPKTSRVMKGLASLTVAATLVVGVNITAAQARDLHGGAVNGSIGTIQITQPPATTGFRESSRTVHQDTRRLGGGDTPTVDVTIETLVVQWRKPVHNWRSTWKCTEYQRTRIAVVSGSSAMPAADVERLIDSAGFRTVGAATAPVPAPSGAAYADVYNRWQNQATARFDFNGKCPAATTHVVDQSGRLLTGSGWSWGWGILLDVGIGIVLSVIIGMAIGSTPVGPALVAYGGEALEFAIYNCIGAGIATLISGRVTGNVDSWNFGSFVMGCIAGAIAGLAPQITAAVKQALQAIVRTVAAAGALYGPLIYESMIEIVPGEMSRFLSERSITIMVSEIEMGAI